MKHLIAMAARHPVFSNLLMLGLLAAGLLASTQLVTEIFPEFSLDRVLVRVIYPGSSAAEVEEAVCTRIEDAIEGVDGIKNITSTSTEGIGTVIVELDSSVDDPREVQYDIRDRVDKITTLPEEIEDEPTVELLTVKRPVINVTVSGHVPEATLRDLAQEIRDELIAMPDISEAELSGVRDHEIVVEVSERELRKYHLTFDDVSRAIRRESLNLPSGTLRGERQLIKIEARGRLYRSAQYKDLIVLARPDGSVVRLGDVARISDAFEEVDRFGRFNGRPAAMVTVSKTADQNALKISGRVRKYVEERRRSVPKGVYLDYWYDTSRFIQDRLRLLIQNGTTGLFLVVLCLWFFMNIRLSFWVAMGIPVSFAGALIVFYLMGVSINMISLFAMIMSLGMVVDDAIIVGENIYALNEKGIEGVEASVRGARRMSLPVLGAVMTTVAAFAPLLFVSGIMGKFIWVMPVAVITILGASVVESFFILPAHLRHGRKPGTAPARWWLSQAARRVRMALNRFIHWVINRLYTPVFRCAAECRYVTLSIAVAVLLLSAGLVQGGFVKYVMFPDLDSDFMVANVEFPDGTPVEVTRAAVERIETAARSLDQKFQPKNGGDLVPRIFAVVGQTTGLTDISPASVGGAHTGELIAELMESEKRGVHSQDIVAAWRAACGPIPEASSLVFKALQGGPGGKAITIRLLSGDLDLLRRAADELKLELGKYDGVYDVTDDLRAGKLELFVRLKPEGRVLGITLADLARQLRQGYYGDEAVRIQRGRDEVTVRVRYPLDERRRLADARSVRIRTPDGGEVPFEEVADLNLSRGFALILREAGKRQVNVQAEVDQAVANAENVLEDLKADSLPSLLARYPGLAYSFEGPAQENRESVSSLARGFALALLVIYVILALSFRSYLQPVLVMAAIPFGLVGAVVGHLVMGFPLTLLSVFGIVALSGVVVNDSLVLIDWINGGCRDGRRVWDSVMEAGPARFRAVMLTSLTTVAGLSPMLFEKSFQAQFLIPMAISIAAGLAFATVLTLFVTPSLYLILNDARRVARWLRTATWPDREEVEPACHESEIVGNGVGESTVAGPLSTDV